MKATCNPILTIVMPFFNKKEMVSIMIDSILANTFDNWELLAIDDGADNETRNYLKHYERDERIHFIKRNREPKGAQTCRNIGIELAKGKYIVFFDSDDYIQPYCLEQRVQEIEKHPEVDFVIFPSGYYKEGTFITSNYLHPYGYKIYKDDIPAFLQRHLPFTVWTNIYKKVSLINSEILWDTNLLSLQDSYFNIQTICKGLTYKYADAKPDYGYRVENNSKSISKKILSKEHLKSHLYFLDNIYHTITDKYRKKYNSALFDGILYFYNILFMDGINKEVAIKLYTIVKKYDKTNGIILRLQIQFTIFFSHFISPKRARQIIMFPYLIRKMHREIRIQPKINKLLQDS